MSLEGFSLEASLLASLMSKTFVAAEFFFDLFEVDRIKLETSGGERLGIKPRQCLIIKSKEVFVIDVVLLHG